MPFRRIAGDQMNTRAVSRFSQYLVVACFSHIKKLLVRTENDSRYEQFEIYPETIEQALRSVDCEQRHADLNIIAEKVLGMPLR